MALDTTTVIDYCAAKPEVAAVLGGAADVSKWTAKEVGDGNINFVYIVSNGVGGAIVVKQVGTIKLRLRSSRYLTHLNPRSLSVR